MRKTLLLIPGVVILTALATLGGAALTNRSLTLGLSWFNDWLPASLIAASAYAFARRSEEESLSFDAPKGRRRMCRLLGIATLGILFNMGFRYFLQPLALEALTPGFENRFAPFSKDEKEEDITSLSPLPYSAPVKPHIPSALEKEVAGNPADDSRVLIAVVPEYLHETDGGTQSGYTRENLLRAARDAYLQDRWFDAHYYATTALTQIAADSAADSADNRSEMEEIAKDAWDRISHTEAFINEEARDFFLKKREGYRDLMENRILSAYGIFSALKAVTPNDPDVIRYFDVANGRVQAQYYFTDELESAAENKALPAHSRVYFTRLHPGGGYSLFFAKNPVLVKSAAETACFVRDFFFGVYGRDGSQSYSLAAPYAKLVPVPGAGIASEQRRRFAIGENEDALLVMLAGVDRSNGGVVFDASYTIDPVYGAAAAPPTEVTRYLNFDLATLLQLSAAEGGPEQMNLPALWQFVFKGGQFGFPVETYFLDLADSICLPFIFLLLQFFIAIGALQYGFGESRLHFFRGILFLVLVTVFAYGAFSLLTLISHLLGFALLSALDPLPTLLIMVACALLPLAVCVARFLHETGQE